MSVRLLLLRTFLGVQAWIALAALVVSAAKLAWDVYQDLKAQNPAPAPEQLARRLRLELTVEVNISEAERDKVIAVVVDEVAKAGQEQ